MMEFLKAIDAKRKADKEEMMARMDADKAEVKREREADKAESKAERKADKEEMMAMMDAKMDYNQEKTETAINSLRSCFRETGACLEEEEEQTPEEMEAVEEPQEVLDGVMEVEEEPAPEPREVVAESREVPEGATDEEKFGATEDRAGELHLAVRRHRQQKKRAQVNGGPPQKFAAFRGRVTHRAVPALLKGHVRKGPRRNRHSGVREPGKTSSSRIDGRSLKQRQIKGNVARDTPGGRTCEKRRQTHPECNSGIRRLNKTSGNGVRGRIIKRDQRLETKRTRHEATRQDQRLEIVKIAADLSVRLREPSDGTLWKCRPPPKRKR
jgi:hypothetical protein